MIAIDTNILVRFLTGDPPDQAETAKAIIEGEDVFVATTVLLEAEWVLRSVFRFDRIRFAKAVSEFAGLPRVTLEDPHRLERALDWVGRGLDFADALHLASADGCSEFVTFDRKLAKSGAGVSEVAVRLT